MKHLILWLALFFQIAYATTMTLHGQAPTDDLQQTLSTAQGLVRITGNQQGYQMQRLGVGAADFSLPGPLAGTVTCATSAALAVQHQKTIQILNTWTGKTLQTIKVDRVDEYPWTCKTAGHWMLFYDPISPLVFLYDLKTNQVSQFSLSACARCEFDLLTDGHQVLLVRTYTLTTSGAVMHMESSHRIYHPRTMKSLVVQGFPLQWEGNLLILHDTRDQPVQLTQHFQTLDVRQHPEIFEARSDRVLPGFEFEQVLSIFEPEHAGRPVFLWTGDRWLMFLERVMEREEGMLDVPSQTWKVAPEPDNVLPWTQDATTLNQIYGSPVQFLDCQQQLLAFDPGWKKLWVYQKEPFRLLQDFPSVDFPVLRKITTLHACHSSTEKIQLDTDQGVLKIVFH